MVESSGALNEKVFDMACLSALLTLPCHHFAKTISERFKCWISDRLKYFKSDCKCVDAYCVKELYCWSCEKASITVVSCVMVLSAGPLRKKLKESCQLLRWDCYVWFITDCWLSTLFNAHRLQWWPLTDLDFCSIIWFIAAVEKWA